MRDRERGKMFKTITQDPIIDNPTTGITDCTAVRYGKVITLKFAGTAVNNSNVGTLSDSLKPVDSISVSGRFTSSSTSHMFPAMISINSSTGSITATAYDSGASTVSPVTGTLHGVVTYISK